MRFKKTTKHTRLDEKRPYKKKFRCQNPGCRGFTDCPAWYCGKIYCQKCTLFRKSYGNLPSKNYMNQLKTIGKWKK